VPDVGAEGDDRQRRPIRTTETEAPGAWLSMWDHVSEPLSIRMACRACLGADRTCSCSAVPILWAAAPAGRLGHLLPEGRRQVVRGLRVLQAGSTTSGCTTVGRTSSWTRRPRHAPRRRDRRLAPGRGAAAGRRGSPATQVLHDAGVLHRDIKPSNLLVGSAGPRPTLLIADLGLAKAVAEGSGYTVTAGPQACTAPEQSRGGRSTPDRRLLPRGRDLRAALRPSAVPDEPDGEVLERDEAQPPGPGRCCC